MLGAQIATTLLLKRSPEEGFVDSLASGWFFMYDPLGIFMNSFGKWIISVLKHYLICLQLFFSAHFVISCTEYSGSS